MVAYKRPIRKRTSNLPKIIVKSKSKPVAVARKSRVDALSRAVSKLQVSKYGDAQTQRQNYRSLEVGLTQSFRINAKTPVCWCNEAIAPGSSIFSTTVTPAGLYDIGSIGSWQQQPFPPTVLNPINEKFNLQAYRNTKSLGFEATYLVKGVGYDIKVFAPNFQGYVYCYEIGIRKSVLRATDQERRFPYVLPAFMHCAPGSDALIDTNCHFYTKKLKYSTYINTAPAPANGAALQTNGFRHKKLYCSMGPKGKHIRASDTAGEVATSQDIPTTQQTWLLWVATNNTSSVDSYVDIEVQRNVYWRDSVGTK